MKEERLNQDHKIVLVMGNGFDLDLGLKTSYKSFIDSTYFKERLKKESNIGDDSNVFSYLYEKIGLKQWIDIEQELLTLATLKKKVRNHKGNLVDGLNKANIDLEYTFDCLLTELCNYLQSLDYNNIKINSTALKILKAVVSYPNSEIISYNYTDIMRLAPIIKTAIDCPIEYVHGSLRDRSIILGFQDDVEIDKSFCFMIKSFNPNFRSHNVRAKLLDADEIIFFGHSLGSTDYHYFEDLFRYQSQPDKANQNLVLRIFTYDENARRDILFQLRKMNNKRTDMIYELCDFEIYRTESGVDEYKITKYLEGLVNRISMLQPIPPVLPV
ncbi:AbiH family protein [uncultured Bacteroides sp.]|uniref:AbiH family protein n=1 Tax=uncultured Bacteroides sp. TaxID=162156 RepID=UPI00259A240B|nr:AbiH family protein [uncultured Bacteroides sp.]